MVDARAGWVLATGGLALVAIAGWTVALVERRGLQRALAVAEARIQRFALFDELTGLLSGEGMALAGQRIVHIARRDSDAVSACLVRVVSPDSRVSGDTTDDDMISVAEASEVVFRSGDAVGRVDADTIMVVGKGPGFTPATVESRLVAQMATMAPADSDPPALVVGVAALQPWDEGDLVELQHRVYEDLGVRLQVFSGL